ncbi:MAG TPA: carbamoyltransferase HypF [Terriglobales bacterium]|nr:carbamoyltransferase HypF [Terriglobales bacterium]
MAVRKQIAVSGIVQGVGFRPYVYRLASERQLNGSVRNTAAGIIIEIQGSGQAVDDFLLRLPVEAPPLARITALDVHDLPCNGDLTFRIVTSGPREKIRTLISPDVAICGDCLRELFDPADRRYKYPFINCTNCGPRFTIVRGIPYDRPLTSMAAFTMCPACQREYEDPLDRRFHAQPNACWDCGPQVELWDRAGTTIAATDVIRQAAERLQQGAVVAVKGLGGFHLAVDATNAAAVARLRERKRRVEKPFAVMVPSLELAEEFCESEETARAALSSSQRPIVLLRKKDPCAIADAVAPFNRDLGLFLPYTPLHYLLLTEGRFPALVMTSGNRSEEPIAIDNAEAVERLRDLADFFLVHNRDILLRCDDSVVHVSGGQVRQMRRSRGYVPVPVFLAEEVPPVLAVGGELKNAICLTQGRHAFLSQHVGDLENVQACYFFEEAITHLEKVLEIQPQAVAHDLHPDYFSTRWARRQKDLPLVGVQHHHAHIASCMAENGLDGRVIGIALDGTGYGTDGCIWGGELLLANYRDFERAGHLESVSMPGGEAAIREPWRMAVSYLFRHFGRDFLNFKVPFVQQLDSAKLKVLLQAAERHINSLLTSSCGRLFDAVAALAGIRQQVNYEAQAAIELEMAMEGGADQPGYALEIAEENEQLIISTRSLFVELLSDLEKFTATGTISARFHLGLVAAWARAAEILRRRTGLERVCLSGGSFNNRFLLEHLQARLRASGFQVFTHAEVPAGDGGLSLGQALVAAHRLRGAGCSSDERALS